MHHRVRHIASALVTDARALMTLTPNEKTLDPPEGFTVLQEGKARILQRENDVFYNKAQVVNRDLSLSVMRQFQKVRAKEHAETKRAPKNRRLKGDMCVTPRDSCLLYTSDAADE